MKLLILLVACISMTWIALEEGGEGDGYPLCDLSPVTQTCSSTAQCTFLQNATRCVRCLDDSTPGYSGWDYRSGANGCGCNTKDKVERPGPWTPQTCGTFGGSWYLGKCWFLEHTGLTTQQACEDNGGQWDENQLKCYFGSCEWAWI